MKAIFALGILIGIILGLLYFMLPKANGSNLTNKTNGSNKTNVSNLHNFSIDTAPKDTLVGKMTSLSGDVSFESRVATAPASISNPVDVHQGEVIKIGEKGSANIVFEGTLSLSLAAKSDLSFSQTLPSNMVLFQKDGQIDYKKTGEAPVSIRLLQSLVKINEGELLIGIDTDTNSAVINVKKGGATIGFNDVSNISTVVDLNEGKKYLFDSEARTLTLYSP